MNKIIKKAILKAGASDFELACLAGAAVISADMLWLLHDIVINGFSGWYLAIGSLMVGGLLSTLAVVLKHNNQEATILIHKELKKRLKNCKRKIKSQK